MRDYKTLKYHEARFKASHNSYDRDEIPIIEQLQWHSSKRNQDGCRGLELDLQQSPRNWSWSIRHFGGYEAHADIQFSTYLELLASWSRGNRNHDVITVTLDLKARSFDDKSFAHYFDEYLARYFPTERIFKPGDLIQSGETLADAVRARGWPLLNDMRERFVFCLSGDEDRKKAYAAKAPTKRFCFADVKGAPAKTTKVKDKNRVFFNFKLSEVYFDGDKHEDIPTGKDSSKMVKSIENLRAQQGLILRGYDMNNEKSWKNARKLRVNLMSTDKVRKYSWATVGAAPFVKI